MKFKVGDYVIIIDDCKYWNCINKYRKGKDLKNEIGKMINISTHAISYDIEIINCLSKKECCRFKENGYCWTWFNYEIKSLNSLKLKKFIKHGV